MASTDSYIRSLEKACEIEYQNGKSGTSKVRGKLVSLDCAGFVLLDADGSPVLIPIENIVVICQA